MKLLEHIYNQTILTQEQSTEFINTLINQDIKFEDKIELLEAFSRKEIHQQELTYIVESLIHTMYPTQPTYDGSICVCGTGGDKSNSFNISTTASFIVASAGVPVIKHGNKSITSNSGSTDLLHELGISTTAVTDVAEQVAQKGLAFISAMESYPIMKYIQPVRKAIKTPTIFNLVGPLINPFKLTYQVMGVYDPSKSKMIVNTLKDLGRRKAIVVHGANGMDEATLSGDNEIYELNEDGSIRHYHLNAKDLGLRNADNNELKGGTPQINKQITLNILNNQDHTVKRDIVVLNAALALYVTEKVETIKAGVKLAQHLIDSGQAMKQYLLMGA